MSDLGAAVLLQTLVVEAVDLSDLPGLVVTPQYCDPLPRREKQSSTLKLFYQYQDPYIVLHCGR